MGVPVRALGRCKEQFAAFTVGSLHGSGGADMLGNRVGDTMETVWSPVPLGDLGRTPPSPLGN